LFLQGKHGYQSKYLICRRPGGQFYCMTAVAAGILFYISDYPSISKYSSSVATLLMTNGSQLLFTLHFVGLVVLQQQSTKRTLTENVIHS